MASYGISINQIDTDSDFFVWASGQDLRRFDGTSWEYYNYQNSAVPSGAPYFLDTRSISIDPEDKVWCGVAQGPVSGLNDTAVFYVDSDDVTIGESWNFSDLGTFNLPQEISHIYACPFGDDILAFSTPLNGIGATGATAYTEINGVTGGRLFYYLKETDKWFETVPGYTWPHIYDIRAKGYDGKDYFYYVGTAEGLFAIPQGNLETTELLGGQMIIEQAQVYNTKTSGIISDYIYSLDLDENGNLWIGTDIGLSFFDGNQFWNYPTASPVVKVVSRPNGHVFYASGDGELGQGSGIWHFNGTSHTQFDSSNSSLPNDNVLDIKLVEKNITRDDLTVYDNSLWVLCLNELTAFNYDIPHVYASSKYEGATGWNFTYFTGTGGNPAPLAKVDKYTWVYPEWRIYDDYYTSLKFPGMDPRNLFMTTKLSDIADGEAGKQSYWDNYPIPTYDDEILSESISDYNWADNITIGQIDAYGPTGDIYITSSASIKTKFGTKYYVGGYITGNTYANFGYYNNNDIASIENQNPTLGGRSTTYVSGNTSTNLGSMGFVACYNSEGMVDSILPFRGYWTTVDDIVSSDDGTEIIATGKFKRFIENGDYVWDSIELLNSTFENGPTGAPIGVTNPYLSGLTSGSYTWIYDPVLPTSTFSDTWIFNTQNPPLSGNFDMKTLNSSGLYEDVLYISINYTSSASVNRSTELESLVTGNTIKLEWFNPVPIDAPEAYYRIDRISTLSGGLRYHVTYMYGSTGYIGNAPGNEFTLTGYDYTPNTYPMVRNLQTITDSLDVWELGIKKNVDSVGLFVTKINGDLGGESSLAPLINYPDYNYAVRKYFRVTGFRHFPRASVIRYLDQSNVIKLDVTRYSINLSVKNSNSWNIMAGSTLGGFATLKNLWNRTNDAFNTSDYILQSDRNVVYSFDEDSVLSYVRLSADDLSLLTTVTSESLDFTSGIPKYNDGAVGSIKSLKSDNTTLITGYTKESFTMGGIQISATGSNKPYYLIMNKNGVGVTGALINDAYAGGVLNLPAADKDDSTYYVTTIFGGSGSYFDNDFIAGSTGTTYLLTSNITEQAVSKSMFSVDIDYTPQSYISLNSGGPIGDDQYYMVYGIGIGATGVSGTNLIKTNRSGKILDSVNLYGYPYANALITDAFSINRDIDDNLFMSGVNRMGATGGGYYESNPESGFSLLINQYKPDLGINMGNIISRAGSGSWTWCDVHSTDKGMQIPLLSTVVFSNYASNIYGKQNNNWILKDSISGNELLNVKATPYFIYTFSEVGNYTIYNSVEDSEGNVYFVTKPGYIEIIDHKAKRPDDKNPDIVDSFDYGEPEPFAGRDYDAAKLAKDMVKQQQEIFDSNNNNQNFGSGIIIPNNPDATFRNE
jgi:hypothetical protein